MAIDLLNNFSTEFHPLPFNGLMMNDCCGGYKINKKVSMVGGMWDDHPYDAACRH